MIKNEVNNSKQKLLSTVHYHEGNEENRASSASSFLQDLDVLDGENTHVLFTFNQFRELK